MYNIDTVANIFFVSFRPSTVVTKFLVGGFNLIRITLRLDRGFSLNLATVSEG